LAASAGIAKSLSSSSRSIDDHNLDGAAAVARSRSASEIDVLSDVHYHATTS